MIFRPDIYEYIHVKYKLQLLFPRARYTLYCWRLDMLWSALGITESGGSGLALPQNLLAWCAMALMVLWCSLTGRRVKFSYPAGTQLIITGAILWSLPLLWSPSSAWQWNAATKVMALWGLLIVWLELLKTPVNLITRRHWLLILVMSTFYRAFSVCTN